MERCCLQPWLLCWSRREAVEDWDWVSRVPDVPFHSTNAKNSDHPNNLQEIDLSKQCLVRGSFVTFHVTEPIGAGIGISFVGRRRITVAKQLKTRDQRHPSQICATERFSLCGTEGDSYQCQEKPLVRNGMDWLEFILVVSTVVLFRYSPQTYSCFRSNARWQIFRCFNSFLCKSGHRQIRA